MQLPKNAFEDCCSWSDDSYTRNCIFNCENFELILLCWEKGQITPIHDHDDKDCWVKVIRGQFEETIYKEDAAGELRKIKSTVSEVNAVSYMTCKMGCHSLENLSNERSLTLHLYAKPIRKCNIFDEDSGEFVSKNMVYDTVSNLVPH